MTFASILLIQSLICGLSVALGATLALLSWQNRPVRSLEEREPSPRPEIPALWRN